MCLCMYNMYSNYLEYTVRARACVSMYMETKTVYDAHALNNIIYIIYDRGRGSHVLQQLSG